LRLPRLRQQQLSSYCSRTEGLGERFEPETTQVQPIDTPFLHACNLNINKR
jgi:hypothetical protein